MHRQMANNNNQQQSQNLNGQPPQNAQQQSNLQRRSAPIVGNPQQNPFEWNDQPNVIIVQVRRLKPLLFASRKHIPFHKFIVCISFIHLGTTNGLSNGLSYSTDA